LELKSVPVKPILQKENTPSSQLLDRNEERANKHANVKTGRFCIGSLVV
jgi:hypothetical protein